MRILTVANLSPDPNSGAAGTVFHTNVALRELGHDVDEIWAEELGPRRIRHGNLHALLEQPRAYQHAVAKAVAHKCYDAVIMSQPQAYLAAKTLKQNRFKGLVINRSHGVELRSDQVLAVWHRKLRVPESRWPWFTRRLRRLLHRQWTEIARWCDGVIVGCEMDRQFLLQSLAFTPARICRVPHAVSDAFLKPTVERPVSAWNRILHVGQFAFFKGGELVIEIINRLLAENSDASFTWVCAEQDHATIAARIPSSLRERICLLPWMSLVELSEVYDSHGLFLFPSLFEGFGKAPFEAMARGMCVLAADEAGMHDHIIHQQNGFLFPVGDVACAVEQARSLLRDMTTARGAGEAAVTTAHGLTWLATAAGFEHFVADLRKLPDERGSDPTYPSENTVAV